MLNLPLSSSVDKLIKSISNLGVIFVIFISSLDWVLPPALTPFIDLSMNGLSYSPVPSCIFGVNLVYGGSGPLISSSLTPNGFNSQNNNNNINTNGKQTIQNILLLATSCISKRSHTPFSSSSSGILVPFLGFVPQLISAVSFQPSPSSSVSAIKSKEIQ